MVQPNRLWNGKALKDTCSSGIPFNREMGFLRFKVSRLFVCPVYPEISVPYLQCVAGQADTSLDVISLYVHIHCVAVVWVGIVEDNDVVPLRIADARQPFDFNLLVE